MFFVMCWLYIETLLYLDILGPSASQKELQEVEEHVAGGRLCVFMDDFYHMLP